MTPQRLTAVRVHRLAAVWVHAEEVPDHFAHLPWHWLHVITHKTSSLRIYIFSSATDATPNHDENNNPPEWNIFISSLHWYDFLSFCNHISSDVLQTMVKEQQHGSSIEWERGDLQMHPCNYEVPWKAAYSHSIEELCHSPLTILFKAWSQR